MNMIRAMRFLGITLLSGCSMGVVFTVVFMVVLGLSGFQAVYALGFFGSLAAAGGFAAFYNVKEPLGEGVLN